MCVNIVKADKEDIQESSITTIDISSTDDQSYEDLGDSESDLTSDLTADLTGDLTGDLTADVTVDLTESPAAS